MEKICLHCELLGKCDDVTLAMLENNRGCGSWSAACPEEIDARSRATKVAGKRALEAMIIKNPPKKPAKDFRR